MFKFVAVRGAGRDQQQRTAEAYTRNAVPFAVVNLLKSLAQNAIDSSKLQHFREEAQRFADSMQAQCVLRHGDITITLRREA